MIAAAVWLAVSLSGRADAAPPPARSIAGVQAGSETARRSAVAPVPAPRSPERPRARSGETAIREELDAARRAGTRAAYDLFIARHPEHPLADAAQEERERLR